ncbi:MAG TPA: hypothetical protein VGL19_17810 [Polyangiaceae bacterium]
MRGRLRCFLLFGAFLTLDVRARAEGGEVLSVERGAGADDCPDVDNLAARVANIRGRAGSASNASYVVTFSHTAETYTAVIRSAPNGESQRILEGHGASCAALAQATAVTLALLFDSEPESTPPPKPEPPPAPPPKTVDLLTEPVPVEPAQRDVRIDSTISLGAGALIGVLRPVSPVFTGELGLRVARFRVGLGALWNPTQALSLAPGTVHASLLGGTARSCFALSENEGLSLGLCTGLFVGVMTGEAEGFTANEQRARSWLSVPVELSLAQLSGPAGWELSGAALGSLVHHDFEVDNVGVAYHSPRVGFMLSLRVVGLWSW